MTGMERWRGFISGSVFAGIANIKSQHVTSPVGSVIPGLTVLRFWLRFRRDHEWRAFNRSSHRYAFFQ